MGSPISRPVSRAKPNFPCCFLTAGFSFCRPVCCFQSNPFPHYWLRPSRACHPCGSSSVRYSGAALAQIAPEKRWCRQGVRAMITDLWLAFKRPVPNWLTPADDPEYNTQAVAADLHSDSLARIQTPLLADLLSPLTLIRQNSASRQTAVSPSGCGSSPAPACVPAPWWPPRCWFWFSSCQRSAWPHH